MGQTKTFFVLLSVVAIWTVGLFVAAPPLLAEDNAVSVSIIADRLPGPGTQHGLRKVRAALREKGVRFEQASSLRKAKGRIEIIAGIAYHIRRGKRLLPARKFVEKCNFHV